MLAGERNGVQGHASTCMSPHTPTRVSARMAYTAMAYTAIAYTTMAYMPMVFVLLAYEPDGKKLLFRTGFD